MTLSDWEISEQFGDTRGMAHEDKDVTVCLVPDEKNGTKTVVYAKHIDHPLLNDLTPAKRVELLMALGETLLTVPTFSYTEENKHQLVMREGIIESAMKRCGLEGGE